MRVVLGVVVVVAGWQTYSVFHRVTKAASAKAGAKEPDAKALDAAQIQRDADEGSAGAAFGMTPLDVPQAKGPLPVEDLVARSHRADLLMEKAEQLGDAKRTLEERAALNQALGLMDESPRAAEVRARLAAMNAGELLGRDLVANDPYAPVVAIGPGDSFQKIARNFHLSSDLVGMLNPDVNPRKLRVGAGIKVVQGPFNVCVVRNEGRVDLYARDLYARSYNVHFEDGVFLPAGMYKVRSGGKVVTRNAAGVLLQRVEMIGTEGQEVRMATFYASPTMRAPAAGGVVAGIRLEEADMAQLYAALVEDGSWVRVAE